MVSKYKILIEGFLSGEVPVETFEKQYLQMFKNQKEPLGPVYFDILNSLFESVDAYWGECQVGQETAFTISEAQLRADAKEALQKLKSLEI